MGYTKEERFLLKMHELAQEKPLDPFTVSRAIGQRDKGVPSLLRQLFQANFICKKEEGISFTSQGLALVEKLKSP